MSTGTLFGIGVGPGDPELLTVKAVRALEKVDVVFAACSTKNQYSHALSIAHPHLKNGVEIRFLGFPMTQDPQELEDAWAENARLTAEVLDAGKDAAFLTLGDPMVYSTFGYLLRTLRKQNGHYKIEIIPGVTSYQAAAARTETILAESCQNLVITSGVGRDDRLKEMLNRSDNMIIMKTYKDFDWIADTLEAEGLAEAATLISSCGHEDERVEKDVLKLRGQKLPYLSLMIVKKPAR